MIVYFSAIYEKTPQTIWLRIFTYILTITTISTNPKRKGGHYCKASHSLPLGLESSFEVDMCLYGTREVTHSVGWNESGRVPV